MLEKLGDKVPESLKYALGRAINSLQIKLGKAVSSENNLPVLEIETAFLVLSIFSYGIGQYPEEVSEIRQILADPKTLQLPPL